MKILSIVLVGYRNFKLRQIPRLEYRPTLKTQLILGSNGSGKAQPLSSLVKTPGGWTKMGDLKVGSLVVAKDGSYVPVTRIHPQGLQKTYRITFKDGRSTLATGDHLWKIYCAQKYPIESEVVTTDEIIQRLYSDQRMKSLIWVDLIDSEDSKELDLPIDPYVFGVMLGDGCFRKSNVRITHPDEEIRLEVEKRLENGIKTVPLNLSAPNACLVYGLTTGRKPGKGFKNYILEFLKAVGLDHCKSFEKFIPEIYLHASTKQRLELLQGLMDTDGYIDTKSSTSYCTTSQRLAYEVQYLVRSLGGLAVITEKNPHYTHNGDRRLGRKAYNVFIRFKTPTSLFKLSLKKERANDNNQYAKTLRLRIESIKPAGYEECQCIEIDHPEHLYVTDNFIVTHNSSILKELSPLPAHHSDFEKGGRKEIEISHNGKHYLLQSLFDQDGNRYPFIVDGENLNPGFTVTVYKELVKEHFNYTPEVHALLIGSIRFPTMSVNDRRNWFMKISETDYTYALKYYQRLKEKVRDLQGALKLNQTRLTQETNKCLTEKDEEELRLKIQELNQILNTLIDHRKPRLSNPEEANQSLEQLESALRLDMSRLETILSKLSDQGISKSIDVLERDSITLQAALQSHQNEIVKICESIEKVQKELDAALTSSQHSLEEVQRTLREFEETRSELQSKIRLPLNFDNIDSVVSSLEAVKPSLEDILSQLSQCPRLDYERVTYQQLLDQSPHLNQAYLKLKDAESKLFIQKQHLESHRAKGLTECPQCKHEWYPNYDELKYKQVCKEHENLVFAIGKIEKEIQENKKAIEEHQHFFYLLERYNQNTRHFEALRPFWMYIKASGKLLEEPDSLLHLIQSLTLDLQYHKRIALLEERIKEHQKLQSLMENTKEVDVNKLKQMMFDDNERLHTLQDEMRLKHAQLETTKTQIQTLNLIYQLESKIESLFKERQVQYQRIIEDQCVAALDEIIRNVKLNLSQYERTLSQIDIQKAIVVSLSKQIKEIEYDLELLKKAQKALSPTEGLIAKGMTGFINHFVREVNQFIENIWLYPLEILPIEMEDDSLDLDYRFEVRVNNDPRIVPDINKASRGMQEVINLAFVAVSMKYLGLSNTPIFLDEFAASLDVSHRQSAYRAIDHLIESTDYSQVFIVSHYQDGYSSLSSSEVLVLCDSNVELPKGMVYNQHAQFH